MRTGNLITSREEIITVVKNIAGLEEKFGHFIIPEDEYSRFNGSDINKALAYIANAQILELYRASMKLYDDAGIDRPYFTQRALPTVNQGVPIILSINESYRGNTDLLIRTNPKENPKEIIKCSGLPNIHPRSIIYKQF